MEYLLRNSELEIRVLSHGAELSGIKDLKTNEEYMWQKDPKFWAKSSPVLFPFVGILKDGRYTYEGKEYKISNRHGFARDYEHEVSSKGDNFIEFVFSSNEETKKIYPFDFKFYMKYILEGRKLTLEYRVENIGDNEMYFSLGAHPAFSMPVGNGVDFSDYYIEFEKDEEGISKIIENALVLSWKTKKVFEGKIFKLNKNSFIDDAVILENTNSKIVYLKSKKNNRKIEFKYDGFRYMAFWNMPGAEFICFEPWNGITDFDNCSGDLKEKAGIEKIGAGEIYKKAIEITIF